MNYFLSAIIFSFVIIQSEARRCYVCGIGADEPFKNTRNYGGISGGNGGGIGTDKRGKNGASSDVRIEHEEYNNSMMTSSCEEFDKSNTLEQYIFECPTSYVGCITQIDGTDVTRTCEKLQLNDCQTANGVTYCFCNLDLCNGKQTKNPLIIDHRSRKKFTQTDDEDLIEASGMKETTINDRTDKWTLDDTTINNIILTTSLPHVVNQQTTNNIGSHSNKLMFNQNKILIIIIYISLLFIQI